MNNSAFACSMFKLKPSRPLEPLVISPLRLGHLTLKFSGYESVKLMSYNVNRFANMNSVIATIRKYNPNILMLQEVSSPEKVKELNQALKGAYQYIGLFSKQDARQKRNFCKWETSVAILSKRPPVLSPTSYQEFSTQASCFSRDFMNYAVFKTPNGHELAIINLHLTCLGRSSSHSQQGVVTQKEEMEQVVALIRNLSQTRPKLKYMIVTGDFNNAEHNEEAKQIRQALAKLNLISVLPVGAVTHTCKGYGEQALDDFWISQSAVEDGIVSPLAVISGNGSDHRALAEKLSFPTKN